jgi:2-polyprenyl-3-methyl-5-hydroxy-6-metoxy-1,4-benzoquinol methylase
MKHSPQYHGVYSDLLAYTGLSPADLEKRLERREHFHFEGEHAWWDPKSVGELTWFYRSSVSYLFANADHPQASEIIAQLESEDGPVLDYSGGVGSTVLGLAAKNISCHYFGIGVQEVAFAEFRVERRSAQHLVKIVSPYAFIEGEYRFHAYKSIPEASYGAIVAMDVLEHIPDYHVTAKHLAGLLRRGGLFFESSPFDNASDDPLAIHQRASVAMADALEGLEFVKRLEGGIKVWRKP